MRITDVKVYPVAPESGGLVAPGAGGGKDVTMGWVFVAVETDEGLTGWGECTNWIGAGNVLVTNAVQTVREMLIGRDPGHIEATWQALFRRHSYLGSRGLVTTLISGIDIALWDLLGKAVGKPVYEVLGGAVRDEIPLYTHPRMGTAEVTVESALAQVADGWKALKFDPFWTWMGQHYNASYMNGYISRESVRKGAAIVEAVRDAVGPDIEILIDAHGSYDVASAIRCAKALEPYDLTWFEEPCPPESYHALRQVREAVNVPICTGERLFTRWEYLPVLENRLADYLMCDVIWTGGITEMKKVASLAETYYVNMSPHGAMGPLQVVAGAHAMMTVPNFYRLEILSRWIPEFNASLTQPLDIRSGTLYLSDRPGLGTEPDLDWIKAHPDPLCARIM